MIVPLKEVSCLLLSYGGCSSKTVDDPSDVFVSSMSFVTAVEALVDWHRELEMMWGKKTRMLLLLLLLLLFMFALSSGGGS
jgi:hypothetical protein